MLTSACKEISVADALWWLSGDSPLRFLKPVSIRTNLGDGAGWKSGLEIKQLGLLWHTNPQVQSHLFLRGPRCGNNMSNILRLGAICAQHVRYFSSNWSPSLSFRNKLISTSFCLKTSMRTFTQGTLLSGYHSQTYCSPNSACNVPVCTYPQPFETVLCQLTLFLPLLVLNALTHISFLIKGELAITDASSLISHHPPLLGPSSPI